MDGRLIKFYNCRVLRNHKLSEVSLWVFDGKIIDPRIVFYEWKRKADVKVDLKGAIISPGFIDIQINGGFGVDFSYDLINNPKGLHTVAKGILSHGVTSFCPTLVSSHPAVYEQVLKLIQCCKGGKHGAEILGVHLEGPFINKNKHGAHDLECIVNIDHGISSLQDIYGKNLMNVKLVTLAPEKENSRDVIEWLTKQNIVVCLGHSEADVETGELAINMGATIITHLFNAMLPFHHRNTGLIGLLGTTCKHLVYYGLIADGIHTHPSTLRIAYKSHPAGVVLVTDAVSAMGLSDGLHHIGSKEIQISGNHAYISNTKTLCGSVATMNKCVKIFQESTECTIEEALEAATLHPAKVLGLEKSKGTLDFESDADLVILNDDLQVLSTWIAGECVYSKEGTGFSFTIENMPESTDFEEIDYTNAI